MEEAIQEIIAAIKAQDRKLDAAWLDKLVRRHNRRTRDGLRRVAKRRLLPYYLGVRAHDHKRWESWGVDPATEEKLLRLLKMKPRRTASGVATITVITKPWTCSSDCLYCPNDVRMPKSYLADEPACQRAERNYFDPYLQVRSRLAALTEMGHVTDKIELIVLGGTWSDYPEAYRLWFVCELFRALNDAGEGIEARDSQAVEAHDPQDAATRSSYLGHMGAEPENRDRFYRQSGLTYDARELRRRTEGWQRDVTSGKATFNQAICALYQGGAWACVSAAQRATLDELLHEHERNERATHRVVGLCIETRPDLVTPQSVASMRLMGCTKIQMGIQSLNQAILDANGRNVTVRQIEQAFETLRLWGFKIQVHAMANLLGATPEGDKQDYQRLVTDAHFLPDEVKLYPCCLVENSRLGECYEAGTWRPYDEDTLVDVLVSDVLVTPAYTRISRMIRDISATDIVVGNKKTNLRQMVEREVSKLHVPVYEIRQREVSTDDVSPEDLHLACVRYMTTVSEERFLQWVTDDRKIAGFLRLSLPKERREAMIREVHVYGRVARLHESERGGAQHAGLGKQLVEAACTQASQAGYDAINVISSVGTREYYRGLGFEDADLYQRKVLAHEGDDPKSTERRQA